MKVQEWDGREGCGEGFLELAEEIYQGDECWIPEERRVMERLFGRENLWFEEGEARMFLIPGKARAVGFLSPGARIEGEKAAFFGYWETVEEKEADEAIFESVEEWATSRGARRLCGPINFSTYGKNRVRLEIKDDGVPFVGEPYDRGGYAGVLQGLGFEERSRAMTQTAPGETMAKVWRSRSRMLERAAEEGVRIEALTPEVWLANLDELHGLVDSMFADNFGYTPLSRESFRQSCNEGYIGRTDRDCSVIGYDGEGRIIGFLLVYPHWGPLLIQGAAKARVGESEVSFREHFGRLESLGREVGGILKTGAVAPEYRRKELFHALTVSAFQRGEGRYDRWYGALIRADNPSRRYGDGVSEQSRWYALFSRSIGSGN